MLSKVEQEIDIFNIAESMQFGDIHFHTDASTGLRAIIAIHSTSLGPALGGCRFVPYKSTADAIADAMHLAQGMSYKAALAGIEHGGGKSVIIKPPNILNREALFESFGRFVDSLAGRYITAVDSGTSVSDMDVIARKTQHVVATSSNAGGKGDPSPFTALGVLRGIQAAVQHKLNRDSLKDIHVAIQGAGNVAYHLSKKLIELGARISICDSKPESEKRFADEFGAVITSKEKIFEVECDVFAPCARGGVLTKETVARLKTGIVAGAANNQLADPGIGKALYHKNILYAPDYVINSGGLIHVALPDIEIIKSKVDGIFDALLNIFQQSDLQKKPCEEVAHNTALKILKEKAEN